MHKRIVSLVVAITFLFTSLSARIGYIMFYSHNNVSDSYNTYSLTIDKPQYQLYYRNGERLNNDIKGYVAVIKPTEKCIGELSKHFSYTETQKIIDRLSKGYPIIVELNNKINPKYIDVYEISKSSGACSQLIDKKSSGLLSYTDEPQNSLKISFSIDAKGRLLSGDEGTLKRAENAEEGLILTIDREIQDILSFACENMKSGCAIVMDVNTSEILACVNKPDDSYLNKAFQNYAVGSVFKLIVASCALENDINLVYNCTGNIVVGDSVYTCQNNNKHGYQTLEDALSNSCNCYFVNLALKLNGDKILSTSSDFGFDKDIILYRDFKINKSHLPSIDTLSSKGQLALFGFGQGELLSSPVKICSALCTIANNGKYNSPKLIADDLENKQVISKKTASTVLKYMRNVVENGTGKNAEDSKHKSAGKTATAQTGQYENGVELLNTWFAGVYPYDNPQYAIVVMTERGISGSIDCCPIFRTVVENMSKL